MVGWFRGDASCGFVFVEVVWFWVVFEVIGAWWLMFVVFLVFRGFLLICVNEVDVSCGCPLAFPNDKVDDCCSYRIIIRITGRLFSFLGGLFWGFGFSDFVGGGLDWPWLFLG